MTSSIRLVHCAMCQENKQEPVVENTTEQGKLALLEALGARIPHENTTCSSVDLDRIRVSLQSDYVGLRWHRSCYSDFTNKNHINRLANKRSVPPHNITATCSDNNTNEPCKK